MPFKDLEEHTLDVWISEIRQKYSDRATWCYSGPIADLDKSGDAPVGGTSGGGTQQPMRRFTRREPSASTESPTQPTPPANKDHTEGEPPHNS
jgi:hypothetical protein